MLTVPLLPRPSQTLSIALDGQACQINVYLLGTALGSTEALPDASSIDVTADTTEFTADIDSTVAGATSQQLYMDLNVDGVQVISCRPLVIDIPQLANAQYYGVTGDFTMVDTQGNSQALYTGLGSRWQLLYLEAADLPIAAAA